MAKVVVNPEVDLAPRAGDVSLSPEALAKLEMFAGLKKAPSFEKFPGSTVLRRFAAGEVVCRQGDAGASAFYILKCEDVIGCFEEWPDRAAELERWKKRLAERAATQTTTQSGRIQRRVATAHLTVDAAPPPRPRGWLGGLFGHGKTQAPANPQFIPNDGPTDIQYATRQAPMHEGEVFGEMSCMTLSPRSATIVADADCYLLEFTRNIFDQIQKDDGYRARIDEIYRRRVLDGHLKKLEILRDLDERQLEFIQSRVELQIVDPGAVICDEGDPSDAVYIVRSGLVQVVTETNVALREADVTDWAGLAKMLLEGEEKKGTTEARRHGEEAEKPAGEKPAAAKSAALEALKAQMAAKAVKKPAETDAPAALVPAAVEKPAKPAKPVSPLDALKAGAAKTVAPVGTPAERIWKEFSEPAKEAARKIAVSDTELAAEKAALLVALNELIRDREFLAAKEFAKTFEQHEMLAAVRAFPKGAGGVKKDWSELELRVGGRLLLAALFPKQIARRPIGGPPRVVNYLSRGDIFGEMGVLLDRPRNATCIAYDHPGDDPNRKPGRVELVKIPAAVFRDLLEQSPGLKHRVQQLVETRGEQIREAKATAAWDPRDSVAASPDFQRQGLIQGQKLLLIDLDRCTRCGDCVRACVNTHDDGYSRLFLDGPRFERFLVPSACRQCLNPSCLIGCPVGSIERGDNGQIVIRDWCIGCNTCARQCPYDSIQMHDVGLIAERNPDWNWTPAAGVNGDGWQQPRYRGRGWRRQSGPFVWNWEMQTQFAANGDDAVASFDRPLDEPLLFRLPFEATKPRLAANRRFRLLIVSQGGGVQLWLNGRPRDFEQDDKQKKKGEVEVLLAASDLRPGENLLAARVEPPIAAGKTVLSARLDAVPESADPEHTEVKLVTERAVVCDLCSSLPSARPACVDQCPHEAAIRVDARFFNFR